MAPAVALARALRARGITRVIGYGTGEVASAFIDATRMMGVAISALVDSNPRLHGTRLQGVEICDLDSAITHGVHIYAVLSFAHAPVILQTIQRGYWSHAATPLILNVADSGIHSTR
jgi:hypothetical protein